MTGKMTRTSMLGASCVGILLGAAALLWSPLAEAQGTVSPAPQVQPTQPGTIDRSLPGSRTGILTKANGGTVWINGESYVLAPNARVENRFGRPMQIYDYHWDNVKNRVQYWLGTGSADRQITQMIIIYPPLPQ